MSQVTFIPELLENQCTSNVSVRGCVPDNQRFSRGEIVDSVHTTRSGTPWSCELERSECNSNLAVSKVSLYHIKLQVNQSTYSEFVRGKQVPWRKKEIRSTPPEDIDNTTKD